MSNPRVVGVIFGVLLALAGGWFWSYLPDNDFLRLVGAVTYPEIATGLDGTGLVITALVLVLALGVFAGVAVFWGIIGVAG
ncbi:MAG: hypothetical protein GYB67_18225, partial [Chloroflexi bacterium]|nr:hypothetical protein [Chloroflexota bacterium]